MEALVFGVLAPVQREAPHDLLLLAVAVPLRTWGLVIGRVLELVPPWALVGAGLGITAWSSGLNIVAFIRAGSVAADRAAMRPVLLRLCVAQ